MKKQEDEVTKSELDTMIGVYRSLLNIVVFFAGFVRYSSLGYILR